MFAIVDDKQKKDQGSSAALFYWYICERSHYLTRIFLTVTQMTKGGYLDLKKKLGV